MWVHQADIAGALLSCVGLLIVFAPVLFGGKTLSSASFTLTSNGPRPFPGQETVGGISGQETIAANPYRLDVSAGALAFEPWAEVTAAELDAGQLPLWNPHQGIGAPLAANMQSSVFDPTMLAVRIDPNPLTWDLTILACFAIGAVCTYAFCRVVGMGYLAAVTGATAFSISGYFSLYSNNGFVRAYLYLPLLCLLVECVVRSRRFLPIPLLGLATFGCIAAGMPEITFFVLLTVGAYATYRVLWGPRSRSKPQSVLALAGAFVFGLLLAAPLILLFLEYERISFNVHKGEAGTGAKTDPGRFLLNWVAPYFNGAPMIPSTGQLTGTRNWLGGAAAALAIIGVAARTKAARLVLPFFGAASALLLAKAYGVDLLEWVGRLPGFELADVPTFGLPVASFGLAVIAAAGVDGIRRHRLRVPVMLGALALAASGVILVFQANRTTLAGIAGDQAVRSLGLAAGTATAVVILVLALRPRVAAFAVCALVAVELVVLAPGHFAKRADPFTPPAYAAVLQRQLAEHPHARVFALDGLLYPNIASALGFDDIRMLDALYVDRYFRYIKTFLDPGVYDRFVGGKWGSAESVTAYRDNPMFDLLGARFLVTDAGGAGRAPAIGAKADAFEEVAEVEGKHLFENERAMPRAFVVHDVMVVPDIDAAEEAFENASARFPNGALKVQDIDVRAQAVVEAEPAELPGELRDGTACQAAPADSVEVVSHTADEVRLRVHAACPGLLVLADSYFPGWEAAVNGEAAAIHPTNMAFRGVVVEAGQSDVVFRYRPSPFRAGVALAVLGVVGMTAAGVVTVVRRRRGAPAAGASG